MSKLPSEQVLVPSDYPGARHGISQSLSTLFIRSTCCDAVVNDSGECSICSRVATGTLIGPNAPASIIHIFEWDDTSISVWIREWTSLYDLNVEVQRR